MGLKILHSADWHLDSPFAGLPEKQAAMLRSAQGEIPGRIAQLCRREGCQLMLLCGDLFDGKPRAETVAQVKKALGECGARVLIAPGNHDFYGPDSIWAAQDWPENVYIFKGNIKAISLPDLDCRIYGGAFRGMDCPAMLEGFRAEGEEKYHIGVFHADPTRTDSPYNPVTVAQVRSSGLTYLALGHVHTAGAFRAGRTYCAWPGCPMGRGWDETGDKGVCLVTLEDKVNIRAVSLELPRFLERQADVGRDPQAAVEAALPPVMGRDIWRLTLTGCGSVDMDELRRHFREYPNLELRDGTEPPIEVWADAGEDTLEGVYFRMLRQKLEADPESATRVEQAALLSRRLLLGREVTL